MIFLPCANLQLGYFI